MKIAILGTGMVGRTLAEKLVSLGHDVAMGTRDPNATSGRAEPGAWGAPSFAAWLSTHPDHQSRIDAIEAQARALGPVTARPLGVDLDAVKAALAR